MEKMGYDLPTEDKQMLSQFLDQVPSVWIDEATNDRWVVSGANLHKNEYLLFAEDGHRKKHLSAEELWHTLKPEKNEIE
jgi:hypothetical protein